MVRDQRNARSADAADAADAAGSSGAGRLGLILVVLSLVVYAAGAVGVLAVGPETVAAHFGADGSVTRYDSALSQVLFMTLVVVGLVALMEATPLLARRGPIALINVPNREAWNTPERRAQLSRVLQEDVRLLTAGSVVLMTFVLVMGAIAGAGATIPGWVFLLAVGAFLVLVMTVLVRMSTGGRYEPPVDGDGALPASRAGGDASR